MGHLASSLSQREAVMQGACEIPPELKEFVPEFLATTVCRDPVWDDAEFMDPIKSYYATLPTSNVERAIADSDEKRGAARDFAGQGNYTKGNALFHGAVTLLSKELGKTHILTATALCDLAWCLIEQGRFHEADEVATRAFQIYDETYEADDPRTLTALARIIKTSRMLSNWTKVSALCQRAESSMLAATGSAEQEKYDAEAASEAVRTTEGQLQHSEALDDEKLIAMYNQQLIVKRVNEEIVKIQDGLHIEQKTREDSENSLIKVLEDMCQKMQNEVQLERKD